VDVGARADEYRRRATLAEQFRLQIESIYVRQLRVDNDAGSGILLDAFEVFASALKPPDIETGQRELNEKGITDPRIALNEVYDFAGADRRVTLLTHPPRRQAACGITKNSQGMHRHTSKIFCSHKAIVAE
jgi:hypothetical protein